MTWTLVYQSTQKNKTKQKAKTKDETKQNQKTKFFAPNQENMKQSSFVLTDFADLQSGR